MDRRRLFPRESIAEVAAGRLRHSIVGLPKWMAEPDEVIQERIVFLESPRPTGAGKYLEQLLGKVWCLDSEGWVAGGFISAP